ncbi:MAG: sulfatase [Verrucomicrobiota bacterium]|nr:sulfatase [Verrucomicrobiota bacterium]
MLSVSFFIKRFIARRLRARGLAILLPVLLVSAATGFAQREERRPNVLFILCDDLRPDALGCYGSAHVKTPHIDRLAREGVRFANTFCTTSLCSPSRASILTGLYAHSHGVRDNFTELPATRAHWPQRLRESGYETGYVGKWHMGEENDAPRPGFDWFVTHKGQGKYFDTEWNLNGERRETLKGYYTQVVTDLALGWLQRPREKPWMLCLGHKAPHSFYFPEEKYAHAFDRVRVPYPDTAFQLAGKPEWIKQRLYTWHGIYGPLFEWRKKFPDDRPEAVKDFENMTRAYWGTVLSVDDSVGRLLDFLKTSGQLERTIVVFMGDNGLLNGEHGMVDKRTMHEPSIRIPLLVRYPGLTKEPRVIQPQVLAFDVPPSLVELCRAEPLANIHGKSWVKLVRDGDPAWRKSWFYEYDYEKQFPYTPNVRGVRTDRWKYMHYPHGDGSPDRHLAELYDLQADPEERRNLINDPAQAAQLAELKAELARLKKESGLEKDPMPLDEGIKMELPDQKIR